MPMAVKPTLKQAASTEPRNRLFIGEIRRDWEPKRVEFFLRNVFPDATAIDAYAECTPLVRNRGFAFVSFADIGSAIRARQKLLSSPVKMGGRPLTVDWARVEHTVPAEIMKTISNLFIRNIAPGTTETALKQLFGGEEAGVVRVKIQRTYGFVRFQKRAQAEMAMEKCNRAMLNGSCLEISWARPPPPGRTVKRTSPMVKYQAVTISPQLTQHPISLQSFEGFPLFQVEAALVTPPVVDVPLLTPATTPLSSTPGPSSMLTAPSLAYLSPFQQSPTIPVAVVQDQSQNSKLLCDRISIAGLGNVRVTTASVIINNFIFYIATIFVGRLRFDGPLAPSKAEAEKNAIQFVCKYLNPSIP